MTSLHIIVYIPFILFCLVVAFLLFRYATLLTLSRISRLMLHLMGIIFFWIALRLIYSLLSMQIFGESSNLKILFMMISLPILLKFSFHWLIDCIFRIVRSLSYIKVKDFKKTFIITLIYIGTVVILTDFVFSIIYSFTILLGSNFGYFSNIPNFIDIKESLTPRLWKLFITFFTLLFQFIMRFRFQEIPFLFGFKNL